MDSIIKQKNIDFEIVIADDGSSNNFYEEIKQYFEEKDFSRWSFVYNEQNQGTVCNLYCALVESKGQYVKCISPGDALADDVVIRKWIDCLKETGLRWGFSDAVYYKMKGKKIEYVMERAHPNDIKPYLKGNMTVCRWNYIALNDIALGAAILSERSILTEYTEKILKKVIYAEDNVYRMMMFDGIIGCYFPYNSVLYEYGTGISTTKNDMWNKRLTADWDAADNLMTENRKLDAFQKAVILAWRENNLVRKLFIRGKFNMIVRNKLGFYRQTGKLSGE